MAAEVLARTVNALQESCSIRDVPKIFALVELRTLLCLTKPQRTKSITIVAIAEPLLLLWQPFGTI